MKSHQLWERKILINLAAMEVHVYRAGKVTSSKQRQFKGHLNRTREVATM
jgi:hypothetical protein